jgi:hypothetical protein
MYSANLRIGSAVIIPIGLIKTVPQRAVGPTVWVSVHQAESGNRSYKVIVKRIKNIVSVVHIDKTRVVSIKSGWIVKNIHATNTI